MSYWTGALYVTVYDCLEYLHMDFDLALLFLSLCFEVESNLRLQKGRRCRKTAVLWLFSGYYVRNYRSLNSAFHKLDEWNFS